MANLKNGGTNNEQTHTGAVESYREFLFSLQRLLG